MNQIQEAQYITTINGFTTKKIKAQIKNYNMIINAPMKKYKGINYFNMINTVNDTIKNMCNYNDIICTEYAPIAKYSKLKKKDLIQFINRLSFKAFIIFMHPDETTDKMCIEYAKPVECEICCVDSSKDDFRSCNTCKNKICKTCIKKIINKPDKFTTEYKCPYCRTVNNVICTANIII